MHDEGVDVGGGDAVAIAITAKGSLDLGAVHSMAFKEAVQLGVVLSRVDCRSVWFVVAQEELGHVLAMTWKGKQELTDNYIELKDISHHSNS